MQSSSTQKPSSPVSISKVPSKNDTTPDWHRGRRIVELGHLGRQLMCVDCGQTLSLTNICTEWRYGFGSLLYVKCLCWMINKVTTNKSHRMHSKGVGVFDVNTMAAIGTVFVII